jgi:hypothetical protein
MLVIAFSIISPFSAFATIDIKEYFEKVYIDYYTGAYEECISKVRSLEANKITPNEDECLEYYMIYTYGAMAINVIETTFTEFSEQHLNLQITKNRWASLSYHYYENWLNLHSTNLETIEQVRQYLNVVDGAYKTGTIQIADLSDIYKKRAKEINKQTDRILKKAYDATFEKRHQWDEDAFVRLGILYLAAWHLFNINNIQGLNNIVMPEYWDAVDYAVIKAENDKESPLLVEASLQIQDLGSMLRSADFYKNKEVVPTILDFSLKARDFKLFAAGAKQYRNFRNTSWKSIQKELLPGEYCIEHFEGHAMNGMFYLQSDNSTRYRNYAFIWNNETSIPDVWNRGYRDKIETQGFSKIESEHPDLTKIYSTGTDAMALTDYAHVDSHVYRLHSLSSLLQRTNNSIRCSNSQTFIGEINYTLGEKQLGTDNEKGTIRNTGYRGFATDSQLLEGILSTLNNVRVINGDNVSIASVMYALKNSDIVHISTHGKFDSDVFSSINSLFDIGLLNGTNVLKSCKLILSGYNDNQHNYLDGYTISQMDLSNISLLFLDACQTAAGKRIAVGSYSFAEAFHYAGVKNIIATLDPISPKVTLDFATRFYRLLKDGMSYHDAFYKTKKEICPSERIILWE